MAIDTTPDENLSLFHRQSARRVNRLLTVRELGYESDMLVHRGTSVCPPSV